jgi:hypothetical protein
MIIDKIIDWLAERISSRSNAPKDDIAFGLMVGLAVGLAVGLVGGLAVGLAVGLVGGLAVELAVGLVGGLAVGLAVELAVGLAVGLVGVLTQLASSSTSLEWIAILAAILVITEVLFWIFDKSKPNKEESKIGFTIKRKGLAFLEALYLFGNGLGALEIISKVPQILAPVSSFFAIYGLSISKGISIIAVAIIAIAEYIWLNSLKYRTRGPGKPRGS